ncbi:MAG: S8 family serine peptidase [Bacteriovoracaceae bacterium]
MRSYLYIVALITLIFSFELIAIPFKAIQFENKKANIVPASFLIMLKPSFNKMSLGENKKFIYSMFSKVLFNNKNQNKMIDVYEVVQLKNQSVFDVRVKGDDPSLDEAKIIAALKKEYQEIDEIGPNFIYKKMDLDPIPYIWENITEKREQVEINEANGYTWNMNALNVPAAHKYLTEKNLWNKKIKIAVLDTGLYTQNPYIAPWENAYNFYHVYYMSGAKTYQTKNEYEPALQGYRLNDETGKWEDYEVVGGYHDWVGHGTHCAGMVAGKRVTEKNFNGVAPGYMIIPVKILDDEGMGSSGEILQGVMYAVKQGAQVLSMSLGGPNYDRVSEKVYKEVYDKGIPVVAAAGNSYEQGNPDSYPGGYPTVLAVASLGSDDFISYFSESHDWVDIAAPGGDGYKPNRGKSLRQILSTWTNDSRIPEPHVFRTKPEPFEDRKFLAGISGTSMATPQIAGLVALIRGINLKLTPDQIKTLLQETGVKVLGGYYPKQLTLSKGLKKADAYAAVKKAAEGSSNDPNDPGNGSGDWSQVFVEIPSNFPTNRLYWLKATLNLNYNDGEDFFPPGRRKQDLMSVNSDSPFITFSSGLIQIQSTLKFICSLI